MSAPSSEEQHELKKTRMVFVKWMKPPLGWFKLNTDGSSVHQRKLQEEEEFFEMVLGTGL